MNLADLMRQRRPDVLLPRFNAFIEGEGPVYVTAVLERTIVFELSSGLPTLCGEVRAVALFSRVTVDPDALAWVTPKLRGKNSAFTPWTNREDSRRRGGGSHKAVAS